MVKKTSIHLITPLEATWECFKIWGGPKHKSLWDQKTTWTYRALQTLKQPHWERLKGCPGLLFGRKGFDLRMVFGSLLIIWDHYWLFWVTPDYFGSLLTILDPSWLFWIPPDYFGSLLIILDPSWLFWITPDDIPNTTNPSSIFGEQIWLVPVQKNKDNEHGRGKIATCKIKAPKWLPKGFMYPKWRHCTW